MGLRAREEDYLKGLILFCLVCAMRSGKWNGNKEGVHDR